MSVDRFELQQREYIEKDAYHFSDLTLETAEGIESWAKLELTLGMITRFNPKRVTDFGCGEGVLVHMLRSKEMVCIGVDLSRYALRLAPEPIRGFLIQGRLEDMPLGDNCADVGSMIAVLEHIPPPNIPNILQEVKRVIIKKGRLVVRVPSVNQPLEPKHYQHFTEESLREILGSNGFSIEQIIGNHDTTQNWSLYYSSLGQTSGKMRYQAYQETFAICDSAKAKRLLAICRNQ